MTLAFAVAVPVLGLPCWILVNRADLPTAEDEDLEPERYALPLDQDGYVAFRATADAADQFDEESSARLAAILKHETWDPEWIDEVSRRYEDAFGALKEGLAAPRLLIPAFTVPEGGLGAEYEAYSGVTLLVRIAAAQSQILASQGDADEAIERALLGMKVGRKLSEAHAPNLISMMFAITAQSISIREFEYVLRDLKLSKSEARSLSTLR